MARIIGNTTATPMPVPDWNQTDEKKAAYIKNKPTIPSNIGDRLAEIEAQIGDILYEEISITSFKSSVSSAEMGSTVTDVTLSWEINKTPTSLSLGSEALDVNDKSKTLVGLSIKSNKSWSCYRKLVVGKIHYNGSVYLRCRIPTGTGGGSCSSSVLKQVYYYRSALIIFGT